MTIIGISQTEIEANLINQKMNEVKQQTQSKTDKGKDDPIVGADTVKITANVSEMPAVVFEPIDEEQAIILAQLVAYDLGRQSFGMSSRAAMDALRSFM